MDRKKLSDLRNQAGLSQWELSTLCKVSPATISEIERGVRSGTNPRLATLEAISAALALRLDRPAADVLTELVGSTPEPEPAAKAVND